MAQRQRLELRQTQRLALTPALRESLQMLQLPADRIEAALAAEAAENPFLRLQPPRRVPAVSAHDVALETTAAGESLHARIAAQIRLMDLPAPVRAAALALAGELGGDGYLAGDTASLAAGLGLTEADAAAGLVALQACEPAGVGARDLAECLALQLVDQGTPEATARAIVARLDGFARRDWPGLTRALGLPRAEIERLARRLQGLRPRPVEDEEPAAAPLVPDLVVERGPDGPRLRLAREYMPRIGFDRALMARSGGAFAESCRLRAHALMRAVRFRGTTLLRVGAHVLAHQRAHLLDGADGPRPLSRAETAAALDLHPSTVGRAVAGKALEIDGVLHPLGGLFSNALPLRGGGQVSAAALRRRIAAMIAEEPPARPLSDAAIRERLAASGVDIARRTVAKYRRELRLAPSSRRRHGERH